MVLSSISSTFAELSQVLRQIIHVLLTLAPLYSSPEGLFLVRLACVKHAASVRSEPGSNSPVIFEKSDSVFTYFKKLCEPANSINAYSIFKELFF